MSPPKPAPQFALRRVIRPAICTAICTAVDTAIRTPTRSRIAYTFGYARPGASRFHGRLTPPSWNPRFCFSCSADTLSSVFVSLHPNSNHSPQNPAVPWDGNINASSRLTPRTAGILTSMAHNEQKQEHEVLTYPVPDGFPAMSMPCDPSSRLVLNKDFVLSKAEERDLVPFVCTSPSSMLFLLN